VSKRHFQANRIFAAEDALPGAVTWSAAQALVERVCSDHDIPVPNLVQGDALTVGESITLPRKPSRLTVLHALAHLLTDPMFPPHGAEFAAEWLALAHRYTREGPALEAQLDEQRVHRTAEEREEKVRRGATYLANNRRGQLVELVLDGPPERVAGSLELCDDGLLRVGGREFPLERARYIYRMEMV
jgi:hypothetical protein